VYVHAHARQESVSIDPLTNKLEVYVRAPAREGKANERVVELVAEFFKIAKSRVTIKKGQTSRNKILEVDV
jgi:uncharacterized protein (TIGR00251 family)